MVDQKLFQEIFKAFDEAFKCQFKIIIVTSSNNPEDMEKAKTFKEVLGYENKPLSFDGLLSLLNRYF